MAAPSARRRAGLDAPSSLVTQSLRSFAPQCRRRGPPGLLRSSVQTTRPKHLDPGEAQMQADQGAVPAGPDLDQVAQLPGHPQPGAAVPVGDGRYVAEEMVVDARSRVDDVAQQPAGLGP